MQEREPAHAERDVRAAADAIDSLGEPTYRTCARCGKPIPEHRLAVDPGTSSCQDCSIYEALPQTD